jgi:hypothetical protein
MGPIILNLFKGIIHILSMDLQIILFLSVIDRRIASNICCCNGFQSFLLSNLGINTGQFDEYTANKYQYFYAHMRCSNPMWS